VDLLGGDALCWSRHEQRAVDLVERPLRWLRDPSRSVCVLNWRNAETALAGCPFLRYESDGLRLRVERAFSRPRPMPRLEPIDA
jgi:hypothetical protein